MHGFCGLRRVLCVVVAVCYLCRPALSVVSTDEEICELYRDRQVIYLDPTASLQELHIRHNLRGDVEIRDSHESEIRIEVEKAAPVADDLSGIIIEQERFDLGEEEIYVLQLDYHESRSRIATVIIGSAVAGIIFLSVAALLVWWFYRRRHSFSPIRDARLTPRREDSRDSLSEGGDMRDETGTPRIPAPTVGSSPCPPPPPPCRTDPAYMTAAQVRACKSLPRDGDVARTQLSPERQDSAGGAAGATMSKTMLMTLTLVALTSAVYASCSSHVTAKVVIYVPPNVKLRAVRAFFNVQFENELIHTTWIHRNGSRLQVFDLEDASPTHQPPCDIAQLCHSAYNQDLGGCNAALTQCVCERGFELENDACVDIDECTSNVHQCPQTANCDNTNGNYVCQCGYGYYGDRHQCKYCSGECPPGFFESSPCGLYNDRVCTECTKCEGSMYEARACTSKSDRQCMHVAHPLLIAGEETTPTFIEGLKVEKSDNVFAEDLHSMKNLETKIFVTDITQASDFYWDRESGLRVKIGVLEVNLIPKYEDADHDNDNQYMLSNPNTVEDQKKFSTVVRDFCRSPIPDYYSVTLELYRDRTTAGNQITCDSKNPLLHKCPPYLKDGEKFLYRSLNEPCNDMGTFPKILKPDSNSMVCTEKTNLLRDVFNQTYTTERPIPFPPRECKQAKSRCQQCLDESRCRTQDVFARKCCQVDCYILADCKQAFSEKCTSARVQCAQGDAYRYTIQPVFQQIKEEFQCHLKHKAPEVLYKFFYYIQVPDRGFQTLEVQKTVYAGDLNFRSHGQYQSDYVTVEHNTGLNLAEDFILKGYLKDTEDGVTRAVNHSVHNLKKPSEYKDKRVVVHEITRNVFVASTQFAQPFSYSTTSWVRDNDCNKNVSLFKSVQKHYHEESQSVNMMMQSDRAPFQYFLKSAGNPPHFKFTVPGNMSILPYYFKNNGTELITNDSLSATLTLVPGGKIWNIHIRGMMSDCPAYLGVTINNRLELEELFRYDLLILCPVTFDLMFMVPNWGQQPDKTFDIKLTDSERTYDIYLTKMIFEQQSVENRPQTAEPGASQRMSVTVTIYAVVGGITTVCLLLLLIAYIYTEFAKVKKQAMTKYMPKTSQIYTDRSMSVDGRSELGAKCGPVNNLSQGQSFFIAFYIVVRLVYSLVFTFTVFFAILMVFIDKDIKELANISKYQGLQYNTSTDKAGQINEFGQSELLRQSQLVSNMQGACSNYIGELFSSLASSMENVTASQHLLDMHGQNSSISYFMQQRADRLLNTYQARLNNYNQRYHGNVSSSIQLAFIKYTQYLRHIYESGWFSFPQKLLNDSDFIESRPLVFQEDLTLQGPEVDFGAFLGVEEVEQVQLWPVQFSDRYFNKIPRMPSLPVPVINHNSPECSTGGDTSYGNLSAHTSFEHLDSSMAFATHLADEPIRGPRPTSTYLNKEYKFLSVDQAEYQPQDPAFSVGDFVGGVNTEVLRILFLVLDAVLLIYRFTHTYINATMMCKGFEDTTMDDDHPHRGYKCANQELPAGHVDIPSRDQLITCQGDDGRSEHSILRGNPSYTTETAPPHPIPDYSSPWMHAHNMSASTATVTTTTASATHYSTTTLPITSQHIPNAQLTSPSPLPHSQPAPLLPHYLSSFKWSFTEVLMSESVPKILIAAALAVLFYVLIKASIILLDMLVFSQLEGFSLLTQSLDVQINQTNWYLADQAAHFNDVTMKIYESQMKSELLNLESMLEYFNSEQVRIVKNYMEEGCAVKNQSHRFLNWTCDITIKPPQLNIPMLPCNFIPIQPQLYSEALHQLAISAKHADHVSFQPLLSAAQNSIVQSGYGILIAVAAMVVIHIAGSVIFQYLKLGHRFPVRRVLLTSTPPGCQLRSDVTHEESDFESEDLEPGYESYASPGRPHRQSPSKTNTLSADFKYSETKV